MVEIGPQVEYWQRGGSEDMEVAAHLVQRGNTRHGLFLMHLALEKILKAHICKVSGKSPPRIHNLVRLVETAKLELTEDARDILADMNEFNLEGRYPLPFISPLSRAEADSYMARAKEVFQWLISRL
jgi:HEPN domain-containing protein